MRRELAPYLARPELAYGAAALLFILLILWGPTVQTRRVQTVMIAALSSHSEWRCFGGRRLANSQMRG